MSTTLTTGVFPRRGDDTDRLAQAGSGGRGWSDVSVLRQEGELAESRKALPLEPPSKAGLARLSFRICISSQLLGLELGNKTSLLFRLPWFCPFITDSHPPFILPHRLPFPVEKGLGHTQPKRPREIPLRSILWIFPYYRITHIMFRVLPILGV